MKRGLEDSFISDDKMAMNLMMNQPPAFGDFLREKRQNVSSYWQPSQFMNFTTHKLWDVRSAFRDQGKFPNRSKFTVEIPQDVRSSKVAQSGISALKIVNASIPCNLYNVRSEQGFDSMLIWEDADSGASFAPTCWKISVPEGYYDDIDALIETLNSRIGTAVPLTSYSSPAIQTPSTGDPHNYTGMRNKYEFAYDEITNRVTMRSVVHNVDWGIQCSPTTANSGKYLGQFNNEHKDVSVQLLQTTGGNARVLKITFPSSKTAHNMGPNYLFNLSIRSLTTPQTKVNFMGCCLFTGSNMSTNAIGTNSITYTTRDNAAWPFESDDDTLVGVIVPFANTMSSLAYTLGFTITPTLPETKYNIVGIQDGNNPPPTVVLANHKFLLTLPCDFRAGDAVRFEDFPTISTTIGPYTVATSTSSSTASSLLHEFEVAKAAFTPGLNSLTETSKAYVVGCYTGDHCVRLKSPTSVCLRIKFDERTIAGTRTFDGFRRDTDQIADLEATVIMPIISSSRGMLVFDVKTFSFPVITFESPIQMPNMLSVEITDEDGILISTSADWNIQLDPVYGNLI